MPKKTDAQHIRDLNRLSPATNDADLGQVIADLIAQHNALVADLAATNAKLTSVLAKMDLDAGITDTNYAATGTPAAMTAVAVGSLSSRS